MTLSFFAQAITRDYVSIIHFLVPQAIEKEICAAAEPRKGPVIFADYTDGMMGGAYGDGIELLAELLRRDPIGTVIGPVFDPVSVAGAMAAGEGSTVTFDMRGRYEAFCDEGLIRLTVEVLVQTDSFAPPQSFLCYYRRRRQGSERIGSYVQHFSIARLLSAQPPRMTKSIVLSA